MPPANGVLNFTSAAAMSPVTKISNRDSAIINVPFVAGAQDYRVLILPAGSSVGSGADGVEVVQGGTLYCAGLKQRNGNGSRVLTYNASRNTVNRFYDSSPSTPRTMIEIKPEIVRQIEVTNITAPVTAYVEAIDTPCPFPGILGSRHQDIVVNNDEADLVSRGISAIAWNLNRTTHSIYTEAEMRQRYGTLIINGQGHAAGLQPGAAAPAMVHPKVLARATIALAPDTSRSVPTQFFDDFSNASDPLVKSTTHKPENAGTRSTLSAPLLFTNSKWNVYARAYEAADVFIKDGALHTVLADWSQDIMASLEAFPKQVVHVNPETYLYVRVEVSSDATDRRYPLFGLYGTPGTNQVFKTAADGNRELSHEIIHTAFFYQTTGANPSLGGWNALQIFGRDGYYTNGNTGVSTPVYDPQNPSSVQFNQAYPDTDLMVLINKQLASLPEPLVDNFQTTGPGSVVHVSPYNQMGGTTDLSTWYYQTNRSGKAVAPVMDDQMVIAPRTQYEFYIRSNRLIVFINGQQRICNDFNQAPASLTMAEGVLGFSHIFYHSTAERQRQYSTSSDQVFTGNYASGQSHYLNNIPFIDERTWDNIGFQEGVSAPSAFDSTFCYSHSNRGAMNNE